MGRSFDFKFLMQTSVLMSCTILHANPAAGSDITINATVAGPVTLTADGNTVQVTSSGGINGGTEGIAGGTINANLITNRGNIEGTDFGINVNNASTVINHGTVTSTNNDAIHAGDNSSITNYGTASSIGGTGGDGLDLENFGTVINYGIVKGGQDGIDVENDSTVINHGSIIAVFDGIDVTDRNTVINHGTINAADDGIDAFDDNTITNFGTIVADADGLDARDRNTISNFGSITAAFDGMTFDSNNLLVNHGSISGLSHGLNINDNNTIINHGTITGNQEAISADLNTTITNYGTISASNCGCSVGIDVTSGTVNNFGLIEGITGILSQQTTKLINSGTIRSHDGPAGKAIDFQGAGGNTLTFLNKFNVVGTIEPGAGTDSVHYQPGISSVFTYQSLPENIVTHGQSLKIAGNTVSVIDNSLVTRDDNSLTETTRLLGNTLLEPGLSPSNGGKNQTQTTLQAYNAPGSTPVNGLGRINQALTPDEIVNRRFEIWAQTLGSIRDTHLTSDEQGAIIVTRGVVSGFNIVRDDLQFRVFAGALEQVVDIDFETQSSEQTTYIAGGSILGSFASLDLAVGLLAGISEHKSERLIANNTVASGFETATSSHSSWFFSPQVRASKNISLGNGLTITPTVRVSYSRAFHEGYTEAGSSANLAFDARTTATLDTKASLSFQHEVSLEDGGRFKTVMSAGLNYRLWTDQSAAKISLNGTGLLLDRQESDHPGSGFVSLGLQYITTSNARLFAKVEAGAGNSGSRYASGRLGLNFSF